VAGAFLWFFFLVVLLCFGFLLRLLFSFSFSFLRYINIHLLCSLLSFVVVEIREIKYLFPMSFVVEVKTGGIRSHYFISDTIVGIQARELEM